MFRGGRWGAAATCFKNFPSLGWSDALVIQEFNGPNSIEILPTNTFFARGELGNLTRRHSPQDTTVALEIKGRERRTPFFFNFYFKSMREKPTPKESSPTLFLATFLVHLLLSSSPLSPRYIIRANTGKPPSPKPTHSDEPAAAAQEDRGQYIKPRKGTTSKLHR